MLSAAVVPKTDCSFTHNICLCGGFQPSALFVVELWPLSQEPPQELVSIAPSLPFDSTSSFTAIAGTVELFAVQDRFLDSLHLGLQLVSFLFLCGFPRHLLYRNNLAPTSFTRLRLCTDVVFTLVGSVTVDTSSITDVYLIPSRPSQSGACC